MKNNGIKPKTWENFSKLKQEIETMLDKKIDNDYLLNLLIVEGKLITYSRTVKYKIENVVIPLDTLDNKVDHSNPDKQCEVSISENKGEIDIKEKVEKP